jgi:antitoxin component of RelBE/YafQ-DinJ toxin-antitoxin module
MEAKEKQPKSKNFVIRVTEEQQAKYNAWSAKTGVPISTVVRNLLDQVVKQKL